MKAILNKTYLSNTKTFNTLLEKLNYFNPSFNSSKN